ncbi:MAG: DNA helicase, partial [Endozoicomonadaceae bacterium]|nr:DNA helicase [Endozoicomonadaceae bacterium]
IQRIQQLFAAGAKLMDICIVTRNKYYRTDIEVELERAEIQTYKVMANGIDNRNKDGVRLATMHRVKGLEFEDVFIACANDTLIPYGNIMSTDPVELREHDLSERALLHVAMTRAKRSLTITCHGAISRYLE